MLIQIAWRNVWRNWLRSLVVILAVAIGLLAGIFMMAFSYGINFGRARNIIEHRISHVQIHQPEFREDRKMSKFIPDGMQALEDLDQREEVKAVTGRLIANGFLKTARTGAGVQINGILPEREMEVTQLDDFLIKGKFLEGTRGYPIILGASLMEKLGWEIPPDTVGAKPDYKLRKTLTLQFQGADGENKSGKFRVVGVYKTINSKLDELNVYVRASDLNIIMDQDAQIHEIAMILPDQKLAEDSTFLASLQSSYPDLKVENWKDIAPDLKFLDESFATTLYIFMTIIMLSMLFGIINTMLMAILERTRELGMLSSIGMKARQLFSMIVLETFFLTMAGVPVGMLAAFGLISYFGSKGINLAAFAEGGASLGVPTIAYPELAAPFYFQIALMVVFTALFASIFPALRVLRLNPAEAVRAI